MVQYHGDATADRGSTYPGGDYFLTCVDVQDKDKEGKPLKSKRAGHDQFILEMAVADGPYKGRRLWHYLTFIPAVKGENNGHGMALRCLHAFGIPFEGDIDVVPSMFKDVTVRAKVIVEQNDPQYDPKNAIKKFYISDDQTRKTAEKPPYEPGAEEGQSSNEPEPSETSTREPEPPASRPAPAPARKARAPWRR